MNIINWGSVSQVPVSVRIVMGAKSILLATIFIYVKSESRYPVAMLFI